LGKSIIGPQPKLLLQDSCKTPWLRHQHFHILGGVKVHWASVHWMLDGAYTVYDSVRLFWAAFLVKPVIKTYSAAKIHSSCFTLSVLLQAASVVPVVGVGGVKIYEELVLLLPQVAKVLGRDYTPTSFYNKADDQFQAEEMQYYYGKEDPDLEPYEEDWITRELDQGTEQQIEQTMINFADITG
jgi:hypothetical protein